MKFIDAHNHLHDPRLQPHLAAILPALDLQCAVVNGTSEGDWPAVEKLASECAWVLPSFGLHPWFAASRSPRWLDDLRARLDAHPRAGVGEIGLDRSIGRGDFDDQISVFTAQLAIAAERNLPTTIHCVQAWGAMWKTIRAHPLPARGFLMHGFGGSLETMRAFAGCGAYFSFPPRFMDSAAAKRRAVFAEIPRDRLLVETDAPFCRPSANQAQHLIRDEAGAPLNHPANIGLAYAGLANIRGIPVEELAESVAENFARLFGV